MGGILLDNKTLKTATELVMQVINDSGLLLVDEKAARFAYKFNAEREKALKAKWVTPNTIQKYDLMLNVKSHQTVKNMVRDGKIPEHYYCYEMRKSTKVLMISTVFIKQFNETV